MNCHLRLNSLQREVTFSAYFDENMKFYVFQGVKHDKIQNKGVP